MCINSVVYKANIIFESKQKLNANEEKNNELNKLK